MSQNNKLSLWQKIKQMLSASAPQSAATSNASSKKAATESLTKTTDTQSSGRDAHIASDNKAGNQAKAKVSLTKSATDATPIVDCLKQYFDNKKWHYTYYPPRDADSQQSHHLSLRMRSKQLDCGYLFRVQEQNELLAVYGILPFLIPESHQSAAMLLITQINYDMLIGNLEMDVNDGEIRYKNAIDVEALGINDAIIEHLLQSVIAMTTVAYEVFSDLLNTQDPSEDMPTLLGELRQQAEARTFFLPTHFVQ